MPKGNRHPVSHRRCTVCHSGARSAIDRAICTGLSRRAISERFSTPEHPISPDSVWRHGRGHLTVEQRALIATKLLAREDNVRAALLSESENVVSSIAATRSVLFGRFLNAADVGDDRAVGSLAAQILSSLNLTAKVTGELLPAASVNVTSLIISSDYIRLRSDLLAALKPFPEATRAVAEVFRRTGERAAAEIQRSAPKMIEGIAAEVVDAA